MQFKTKLKKWKGSRTQKQAAKELRVKFWTLVAWLSGRNVPSGKAMKKLEKIIGLFLIMAFITGCCVSKTSPKSRRLIAGDGPPDPPCAPNCPTNTFEPQPWPLPSYTNGELFCIALTNFTVAVSNTNPFKEYALQWSDDLFSWIQITTSQIGAGENYFNSNSLGFYRAQEVTGDDLIVYPTFGATNSMTGSGCPGSYVGYWVYRPITNNVFPFQPVGTNHQVIDPTGSTDTRVEMVGRFGDIKCGSLPLTLSTPDPYYTLQIFFKTTMQGTNYPLIMRGFIVRTN